LPSIQPEALESPVPTLVDLRVCWRAPFTIVSPWLQRRVNAHGGEIRVATIDIVGHSVRAAYFGIQVIPAIALLPSGE